jgi:hypothetical protein
MFDFSRLHRDELIAGVAGLLLFVSLFVKWFGVDAGPPANAELCGTGEDSCTAFETFNILDLLLVAGAAAPFILIWIIIRGHELSWPPGEVTAIVGITAAALILYNGLVDRVGEERSFISLDIGWYLALLATLLMLVSAGMTRLRHGGEKRRPPGTF